MNSIEIHYWQYSEPTVPSPNGDPIRIREGSIAQLTKAIVDHHA